MQEILINEILLKNILIKMISNNILNFYKMEENLMPLYKRVVQLRKKVFGEWKIPKKIINLSLMNFKN
jgi:hypothetical protein